MLSEEDARLLRLLEPAPRPETPWLDVHEKLAEEVAAAQQAGVSLASLRFGPLQPGLALATGRRQLGLDSVALDGHGADGGFLAA